MTRIESDLLGELSISENAYFGVQTQRSLDNFKISGVKISHYPESIKSLAYVKWAAAITNFELGMLDKSISDYIVEACKDIVNGKYNDQFEVDVIQGGAGTSTNMNINEVVANIAIEKMGHKKGEYKYCSPHDHVNLSQSTNDAYPSSNKLAMLNMNEELIQSTELLILAFRAKAKELNSVIKMGRTQLQDAVPMTLGQEFEAFAVMLESELKLLKRDAELLLEINMGGTAIGTGLNADPDFPKLYAKHLSDITGFKFAAADNLIAATADTGAYAAFSAALKRLAIKTSKICNDLRLLSSGPRCGLSEINLPAKQPGSSIMPGKVNPVIPEVVNQVCFKVIGNDTCVMLSSEAGQLQLNVMEPVMIYCIFESVTIMKNAFDCLRENCISDITANEDHCKNMVLNSIGIVTALNPYIGYKASTEVAKKAMETNKGVYDIVLEDKILSQSDLDKVMNPEVMTKAHRKIKL